MKAIVKKEPKKGLSWEDVPIPGCGNKDVLIQIEKTAICGTDVHLYKWDAWAQKTLPVPSVIGHECVGRIVEIGKCVEGLGIGDRVSIEGHLTCGICRHCRTGNRVLCPKTLGTGVNRNGCFAEYLSIPGENVFPMPDDIPDDIACIFDPLGNAVHTALSFDLVGKDVLITGAGPIGLFSIPIAFKAGARRVVITDLNEYRLNIAKTLGATVVNISTSDYQKNLIEEFDICLEMSGSAEAFAMIPYFLRHGGKIIILGLLPPDCKTDWHQVIFKMLTIKGIYGREIFKTWYQLLDLLQSGLDITPVITHQFRAEEFEKGFETMISGQSGKIILDWTYLKPTS